MKRQFFSRLIGVIVGFILFQILGYYSNKQTFFRNEQQFIINRVDSVDRGHDCIDITYQDLRNKEVQTVILSYTYDFLRTLNAGDTIYKKADSYIFDVRRNGVQFCWDCEHYKLTECPKL